MNNRYISRYAKHDTHFQRTDPWRHASWDEKKDLRWLFWEAFGTICFIGAIVAIAIVVGLYVE